MKFWDSSAVVALIIDVQRSTAAQAVIDEDSQMLVWWTTRVECVSALARLERQHTLTGHELEEALTTLDSLSSEWHEIQPVDRVRQSARRLLRVHPLDAADALQLAAAVIGSEGQLKPFQFVSFDARLTDAAQREGFPVLELADGTG